MDVLCRDFSRLYATDHRQDEGIVKRLLSGAEVVGGVNWKYLSKSYCLLMQTIKLNHFPFRIATDDDTDEELQKIKEEIEEYFENYRETTYVVIDGEKYFYLSSESTSAKVEHSFKKFIGECQQPVDESTIEDYLEVDLCWKQSKAYRKNYQEPIPAELEDPWA